VLPHSLCTTAIAALFSVTVSATAAPASIATPTWAAMSSPLYLVHEGHSGAAQANGTVNDVDAANHMVNLSHGSIKALGWPAMTMDFPVGNEVNLTNLQPGMRVKFTLVHSNNGMVVDTMQPVNTNQ